MRHPIGPAPHAECCDRKEPQPVGRQHLVIASLCRFACCACHACSTVCTSCSRSPGLSSARLICRIKPSTHLWLTDADSRHHDGWFCSAAIAPQSLAGSQHRSKACSAAAGAACVPEKRGCCVTVLPPVAHAATPQMQPAVHRPHAAAGLGSHLQRPGQLPHKRPSRNYIGAVFLRQ